MAIPEFKLIICFWLILYGVLPMQLSAQHLRFRHLDIDDGLSQNAVSVVFQDSRGFMWLGTKDGLNRYDGYEFQVYQNNPFDSSSLSSNYITSLQEGADQQMFVGTTAGTVDAYDPKKQTFRQIPLSLNDSTGINRSSIHNMKVNSNGDLWVGTNGQGIFIVDAAPPFKVKQHILPENGGFDQASNIALCFERDEDNKMWVGTAKQLYLMGPDGHVLETHVIRTKHPDAPSAELERGIMQILSADEDHLWLGSLSGLVLFNKTSGSYQLFPHRYHIDQYGWGWMADLVKDANGNLWFGTSNGLMLFEPEIQDYTYFEHDPMDPSSLSFNYLSALYYDRTGILWVGTGGMGVDLYDLKSERFKLLQKKPSSSSRINGFSVRSIFEENDSITWISAGVLYRWNRNTGHLKCFETSISSPNDFGNTEVFSTVKTKNGKLLIGSISGLYLYDPQTGESQFYTDKNYPTSGLPEDHVFSLVKARNDSIYFLTKRYFCQVMDLEAGSFKCIPTSGLQGNVTAESTTMIESPDNNFWWGTKDGLIHYNTSVGVLNSYRNNPLDPTTLSNDFITVIAEDTERPDSILWIGTNGGGLNKMNRATGKFEHYTEEDGLPNQVVYGILPDEEGRLWLSTNKGISCFDPKTETFRNYDVQDGLQSNEFNTWSYHRGNSGLFYFGGVHGLTYFHPEEIIDNPFIAPIVFTRLKIKGEEVTHLTHPEILPLPISETRSIELSFKDRLIQIEFAALDFSAPEKNRFMYKLQGFDEEWRLAGTERYATYTNIPPGNYSFLVKGSNNDGIWNGKPSALELNVLPPWYKSNVAYVTYVLALLGFLYFIRWYELKRVKVRNQLALQEVETNSLRELDQLKTEFFDNISHEFRTPLTLIMGQLESSLSEVQSEKLSRKLRSAQSNGQRLMALINQLLDLSKLESGKMELELERLELISFAKNLFNGFEQMAAEKNIQLEFHSKWEELPMVFDPDKLEKMITNLLSNALKFTPEKGKVKMELKPYNDDHIQISVKDTGPGISAEEQGLIFDRFHQVDGSHTRDYEGSGIGLSLVKQLVRIHEGRIELESQPGKGSCFSLILPAQMALSSKAKASHHNGQPLSEQERPTPNSDQKVEELNEEPVIVLVVEDNEEVRNFICDELEEKYTLLQATNGKDGLSIAREHIPDLIITDVMMPEMDGYEFTTQIRLEKSTSHIPLIMLTGKTSLSDKLEGLEHGADAYMPKPFSVEELKVRIHQLITQRQKLRERFRKTAVIASVEVSEQSIDQLFIEKISDLIQKEHSDPLFGVSDLASALHMSESQLNRKLKALIDQSPGELIRNYRLEKAAEMLKKNMGSIAEISFNTGFNDQAYFSRAFKKAYGESPSVFKKEKGE